MVELRKCMESRWERGKQHETNEKVERNDSIFTSNYTGLLSVPVANKGYRVCYVNFAHGNSFSLFYMFTCLWDKKYFFLDICNYYEKKEIDEEKEFQKLVEDPIKFINFLKGKNDNLWEI